MYEENHLDAVLDMPHHIDKSLMRMSWSIGSSVPNRSNRVSAVTLPLSMLRLMSVRTFKRALSVD